eukprot:gene28275-35111_t
MHRDCAHIVELLSSACGDSLESISMDTIGGELSATVLIEPFARHCLRLKEISLSHIAGVGDALVQALCSSACVDSLSTLTFKGGSYFNRLLTDDALQTLALHALNLEMLLINNCAATDLGVVSLLTGCKRLTSLSLLHCSRLGNQHFTTLLENTSNTTPNLSLQVLSLMNSGTLTDSGLSPLLNASPTLRVIDLSYLRKITDMLLCGWSKECCAHIISLRLYSCSELTIRGIEALASNNDDVVWQMPSAESSRVHVQTATAAGRRGERHSVSSAGGAPSSGRHMRSDMT